MPERIFFGKSVAFSCGLIFQRKKKHRIRYETSLCRDELITVESYTSKGVNKQLQDMAPSITDYVFDR